MVIFVGGAGDGAWASVGAARLKINSAPKARPRRGCDHHMARRPLVIDHHAPWDTPDWHRDRRLATRHVDYRYVVTKTVGDKKCALVARQHDAPGALADQDIGGDLPRRYVHHCDMRGVTK